MNGPLILNVAWFLIAMDTVIVRRVYQSSHPYPRYGQRWILRLAGDAFWWSAVAFAVIASVRSI